MALMKLLLLRKPRGGCLEGRTALIQPTPIRSHPLTENEPRPVSSHAKA